MQMIDSVHSQDVPGEQRIGVLGERAVMADLQHLRVTVCTAGLEHQRGGPGGTAYQRGDTELGDGIGQVVAVGVVAEDAGPGGIDS